ncbi:MAG TPA: bifunctional folylpolyglutamate synthase/dihydrofolate synthase [Crocinitomix sp.]|nr:bifunctional folylpolyglutamate synthase/dihydrofolate synthase [Crocinitomix sp.]
MKYQSAIDYLFNQLANYQKTGSTAYKPGLDNIKILLNSLNNPEKNLKTIHLAGTNGKGSTAHIIASILIENGYKVGLFTSPHIKDFRERIKINGKIISQKDVTNFIENNRQNFKTISPSFFEITTAMAFYLFNQYKCDISIIETGLGGRLDSTNVIEPEVSVITNIGIDHTEFLGDTIEEITVEKAGIIKYNTPVVIGEFNPITYEIFQSQSKEKRANIVISDQQKVETDLLGQFQQQNCSVALTTINVLKEKGWYIDNKKTQIALTRVKYNTNLRGRLEQISLNPKIIIDASHNEDGIRNLFKEVSLMTFNNLHCIYATSSDKNVEDIMSLFPKQATYYLTTFNSKRSLSPNELEIKAKKYHLSYSIYKNIDKALESAKQTYHQGDLILIFGSFFLLEKII